MADCVVIHVQMSVEDVSNTHLKLCHGEHWNIITSHPKKFTDWTCPVWRAQEFLQKKGREFLGRARFGLMESRLCRRCRCHWCAGPPPPPGWLTPLPGMTTWWMGRWAFALTKRTCFLAKLSGTSRAKTCSEGTQSVKYKSVRPIRADVLAESLMLLLLGPKICLGRVCFPNWESVQEDIWCESHLHYSHKGLQDEGKISPLPICDKSKRWMLKNQCKLAFETLRRDSDREHLVA